jgi:hypothetical protein
MSFPWWADVALFVTVTAAALGGWWLYRQVRPKGTENEWIDREDEREPMEAVEGFTRRWAQLQTAFMRHVALCLVVLAALIAASLGINVTLYAAQREDDRQQSEQTETNRQLIERQNADMRERRDRAAATDRQQCEDIERLKANARKGARDGRRTINSLTFLSAADKARLMQSSRDNEKLFGPRTVTTRDGKTLRGVAACASLPNTVRAP